MEKLLLKRWFQLTVGAIALFVLGLLIPPNFLQVDIPAERPDRLVLQTETAALSQEIPLTDAAAIVAGWKDPGQCLLPNQGRAGFQGRYFAKDPGGETAPFLPIYNQEGALLGVYLISETAMLPPWQHEPDGLVDVENMAFEHWGLHVHIRDITNPCEVAPTG